MRLPAFLLCVALLVSGILQAHVLADDSGYVRIDLWRTSHNHLMVTAKINGRRAEMLIDTGAATSAVAASKTLAFGFQPLKGASRIANGTKIQIARIDSLQIGPTETRNLPVAMLDFPQNGMNGLGGIVGIDLLRAVRATVDCQRMRLYWKLVPDAPNVLAQTLPPAGWTAIPMEDFGNHFVVRATVNGQPVRLLVDTGAFATTVLSRVEAGLKTNGQKLMTQGFNHTDKKAGVAIPAQISIGAFTLRDFPIAVNQTLPLFTRSGEIDGLLGADILGRNLGMIDCEKKVLYLKAPNAK